MAEKTDFEIWISKLNDIQKVVYPIAVGCFVVFVIMYQGTGEFKRDSMFFTGWYETQLKTNLLGETYEAAVSTLKFRPKFETIIPFGLSIVFALIGYFSPKK